MNQGTYVWANCNDLEVLTNQIHGIRGNLLTSAQIPRIALAFTRRIGGMATCLVYKNHAKHTKTRGRMTFNQELTRQTTSQLSDQALQIGRSKETPQKWTQTPGW